MTTSPSPDALPFWQRPATIIVAGCLICLTSFGVRSSFGLFTAPISDAHGWPREVFGLALALQNLLWGLAQPFAGAAADRFGTARVLAVGALIYATGVALIPYSDTPGLFYLSAGMLSGIGIATASFAIVMTAFSRRMPPERRSWAFGIATSASSLGQFVFAPLGQAFIAAYGWQTAMLLLAVLLLFCLPLTMALRGNASDSTHADDASDPEVTLGGALAWALRHRSYVLLVFGFFVCGFQLAFITIHMPPYLTESGIAAGVAAGAIAIVGLANVVGSYISGILGGRLPKRYLLSAIYFGRAAAITGFLLVPLSTVSVFTFAVVMGLLWLSTVPPTAGLVALMFGTRYMGMLYGIVFFSHQVGSFLGVWLGGVLYDRMGNYDAVWWLSVALGLFATLVHLPIREARAPDAIRDSAAA